MKLCHMTGQKGHKVGIIIFVHILRGPHPRNLGGPKIRKLVAGFQTTSDFDREYLRNQSRY